MARWRTNAALRQACGQGDLTEVLRLIGQGATAWNDGLDAACRNGHRPVIDLMIQKGANDFIDGLRTAARNGHTDVVKLMLSNGATNVNDGLVAACEIGHRPLIELMIQNGADAWTTALQTAAYNGRLDIVKLMFANGATNLNDGLRRAYDGRNSNDDRNVGTMAFLISKGATNVKDVFYAPDDGDLLKRMLETTNVRRSDLRSIRGMADFIVCLDRTIKARRFVLDRIAGIPAVLQTIVMEYCVNLR